ncbi:glycosyltransferase family 2 protein [Candidatus Parcubacteria bacterium]|nr:MAG: glycosyltransferase family 2 protein [Candidatus Parcubacteria bacterium]
MRVSFSIPAYNEEAKIGQCLESVIAEIKRSGLTGNAEIVVVNNASTDRTKEIARSFPGVRVVDESRKGVASARQAGFLATSGDLLANIDADTLVPPGWLSKVVRTFERNEKLVGLSGPYIYYDLPFFKRMVAILLVSTYPLIHMLTHHLARAGAILQGGNFVLRRTALEKIGGFDTSISFYGEDTDIARRIAQVGRVKWTLFLPMYSSGRRLAHEGMVTTGMRYALNYFWIIFTKHPWSREHVDVRVP